MQDLKNLKRFFRVNARGGQAPALRWMRQLPLTRSGSGDPELRSLGHVRERSRGTGPRATDNLANLANRDNPAPHPAHLLLAF